MSPSKKAQPYLEQHPSILREQRLYAFLIETDPTEIRRQASALRLLTTEKNLRELIENRSAVERIRITQLLAHHKLDHSILDLLFKGMKDVEVNVQPRKGSAFGEMEDFLTAAATQKEAEETLSPNFAAEHWPDLKKLYVEEVLTDAIRWLEEEETTKKESEAHVPSRQRIFEVLDKGNEDEKLECLSVLRKAFFERVFRLEYPGGDSPQNNLREAWLRARKKTGAARERVIHFVSTFMKKMEWEADEFIRGRKAIAYMLGEPNDERIAQALRGNDPEAFCERLNEIYLSEEWQSLPTEAPDFEPPESKGELVPSHLKEEIKGWPVEKQKSQLMLLINIQKPEDITNDLWPKISDHIITNGKIDLERLKAVVDCILELSGIDIKVLKIEMAEKMALEANIAQIIEDELATLTPENHISEEVYTEDINIDETRSAQEQAEAMKGFIAQNWKPQRGFTEAYDQFIALCMEFLNLNLEQVITSLSVKNITEKSRKVTLIISLTLGYKKIPSFMGNAIKGGQNEKSIIGEKCIKIFQKTTEDHPLITPDPKQTLSSPIST